MPGRRRARRAPKRRRRSRSAIGRRRRGSRVARKTVKRMRKNALSFRQPYFPDHAFVRLKWYDETTYHVDPASGTFPNNGLQGEIIRANSPRDPEWTTGSGQLSATGWDQWSEIYGKCYVYAAKMVVRITPMSAAPASYGGVMPICRGYLQATRGTQTIAVANAYGSNNTRFFTIGSAYSSPGKTLKMFKKTKHMYDQLTNVDAYCCIGNQDPVNQWFFQIVLQPMDSTWTNQQLAGSFAVQKYVTYYCHFHQPYRTNKGGQTSILNQVATEFDDINDETDVYQLDTTGTDMPGLPIAEPPP